MKLQVAMRPKMDKMKTLWHKPHVFWHLYLDTLTTRVCTLKWAKGQVNPLQIYGETSYFYFQIPSFLGSTL